MARTVNVGLQRSHSRHKGGIIEPQMRLNRKITINVSVNAKKHHRALDEVIRHCSLRPFTI